MSESINEIVTFLESIQSREPIHENDSLILFSVYFGLSFRIWRTLCYIKTSAILLGEGNGTHSSTLAWKILWTEEPGRLQSMGSLRV